MPYLEIFSNARGAGKTVFDVINRKSKIDAIKNNGTFLNRNIQGVIEFKNVVFQYPSRPDVQASFSLFCSSK